jgi:hypothetical protein
MCVEWDSVLSVSWFSVDAVVWRWLSIAAVDWSFVGEFSPEPHIRFFFRNVMQSLDGFSRGDYARSTSLSFRWLHPHHPAWVLEEPRDGPIGLQPH